MKKILNWCGILALIAGWCLLMFEDARADGGAWSTTTPTVTPAPVGLQLSPAETPAMLVIATPAEGLSLQADQSARMGEGALSVEGGTAAGSRAEETLPTSTICGGLTILFLIVSYLLIARKHKRS